MSAATQTIGIFTTDADLIIRSWDAGLARLTAIPATDAIGQPLTALLPDLPARGLLARFERVLHEGVVEVLAPAFHHYLIPCAPQSASTHFDRMQQRVTIAPLRAAERHTGVIVTLLDVTARLDHERTLAEQLASPDEGTRLQAARMLAAEDRPEAAVEPEAVVEPDTAVAGEAAGGLVSVLGDESWRVRQVAVSGLAQQASPETIAALLQLLRNEHHNLSILNSALQVLTLSEVEVILPLTEFLRGPDADLRMQAALALGEQRDARAVPALLAALQDADQNVRYHAIEALGKLRAAAAVEPLLTLAEAGDFFLAFPAIDALLRIGDGRAAPRLAPLLRDELLCGPVADALGQLGDEEVVAPLIALLNQPQAPALVIVQALAALYQRYEDAYGEGAYLADLARDQFSATGLQNLLAALAVATPEQLRSLTLVLGWLEGAAVERSLTQLLGHPAVRKEVIEALVRYGARVTALLLEQLNAEDVQTRQAAVIALGRLGDRQAVPALIQVLQTDQALLVETAGALAKLGDDRAFEPLLGLLGHEDASVRLAVISAINSLGHPGLAGRLVTLLNDASPRVRESAVKIAGYFGFTECVDGLLERCRDADEQVRQAAVGHLPYLEDERVPSVLIEALQSGTPKVRAAAAQAFGQLESAQALPSLLAALRDADAWVRYFAARSIGGHGFDAALEMLAQLAQADPAGHVRIAALEALGQLGGATAVAFIAPFAAAGDRDLACAALKALGCISHPDALPPLHAALRAPDPARRLAAIEALAERGGPGTAAALQWVGAADEEAQVARAAIGALAQLATPEALAALIELTTDHGRREFCMTALARLSPQLIDEVARGLEHPAVPVRCAVVEVFARMKQTAATARLLAALDDHEAAVRLTAIGALNHLSNRQAEHRLLALARTDPDMEVRRAAEKALRRQKFGGGVD
jgi:HEAT repeat protein